MALIGVEIDGFSRSIVEVTSGQTFGTRVLHWSDLTPRQIASTVGWSFDWLSEADDENHNVFALLISRGRDLQGLVSMRDAADHVFVNLIESAPANVGPGKRYRGVPANLFAFACLRSRKIGFDGAVGLEAKSELIAHYEQSLGAKRIGMSQFMTIDDTASEELVKHYFAESDQWPD